MADKDVVRVSASTITIPAHNDYPEVRIPIESGAIQKNRKVRLKLDILDDAGNVLVNYDVVRVVFKEDPVDTNNEVLGVCRLSFNESPKVVAPQI